MRRVHFSDAGWRFRSISRAKDSVRKPKRRRAQQLALESLESRCLLSTIAEYPTPRLSSGNVALPAEITSTGGKLWFTESGGAIGMVNPSTPGTIVSYSQGLISTAGPQGITVGSDGNIWFTESGAGAIGMLSTSNPTSNIQNYTQGLLAQAHPVGITSVPGGDIWFTDTYNNAIGWINPSSPSTITEIQVPSSLVGIVNFNSQIIAGPGGNLYFTEHLQATEQSAIGIYNPSAPSGEQFSQVMLRSGQQPSGITVGPDDQSIWYTWEILSGSVTQSSGIGTFNTLSPPLTVLPGSSFQITTPAGGVTPQPNQITSGPDGELYFTDSGNGAIYSIDPTSHVISQPNDIGKTVISSPLPSGITTGPDGNLWFTDDGPTDTHTGAYGLVSLDTKLAITTQPPANVTTGIPFDLTAKVEYSDTNAVDTAYSGNVAVALTNPGSNTLGGTTSVPLSAGVAPFTTLTLTNAGTGFTLTATAMVTNDGVTQTLTSAPSSGINVTAPATQLKVSSQPTVPVSADSPFSLVIQALTSTNALASSYSGTVTLTLVTSPPGAVLGGTTTIPASGGVASFSGLTLNLPGSYVIQASASGLSSASTTTITVAPQATHLMVYSQPPAAVLSGNPFNLVIQALTSTNALAASYSGAVTLTLAASPAGAVLSGTTIIPVSGGVASFSGLSLNLPGSYVIKAAAGGLSSVITTAITVPSPPEIQSASVWTNQKTNKKGRPIGKPVLIGYQFTFNMAMSPSITDLSDYQVQTYVQVTVKIGKRRTKVLQPRPIGFSLTATPNNTVQVRLVGKQAFKFGGQITLTSGISSSAGTF